MCRSDVAVINTGAHSSGQQGFEKDLVGGFKPLLEACGEGIKLGRPLVFFRTTPEGNPWCNSEGHQEISDMDEWTRVTWPVLTGKAPSPDNLFDSSWHWSEFQSYNRFANDFFKGTGVRMLDVVPMTRLRPTDDWGQTDFRSGKPVDCLHGNGAVHEWNTLIVNAVAALLCGGHGGGGGGDA